MADERIDETEDGYYVRVGDVHEWRWKDGHEPRGYGAVMTMDTAAEVVPPPDAPPAPKGKKKG